MRNVRRDIGLSESGENIAAFLKFERADRSNTAHRNAMHRAIAGIIRHELSDKQREAVIMYYYENKTGTEIASILGVNKSSVSRRLSVSKQKIRRILSYGFFQSWERENMELAG